MNSNISYELSSCISELYRISNELETAAQNVDRSIKGMNTSRYIRTLESCAAKYRSAANRLSKIR